MKFIYSMTIALGLYATGAWASIVEISDPSIQAFWTMPISSRIDLNISWIQIVKSNRELMRIPMSQLDFKGHLEPRFDKDGLLRLVYFETAPDEAIIAVQERDRGWYPPVELCKNSAERTNCRVVFELDTDRKTLTARILFQK